MQRDDTATIPRHTHARTERQTQNTHTLARTLPTHTHECARLAFARCTKLYIQTLYTVEKRDAARQRDVSSGDVETTSVQRERLTQTERARSRVPRCDAARAFAQARSTHSLDARRAHRVWLVCVCLRVCVRECAALTITQQQQQQQRELKAVGTGTGGRRACKFALRFVHIHTHTHEHTHTYASNHHCCGGDTTADVCTRGARAPGGMLFYVCERSHIRVDLWDELASYTDTHTHMHKSHSGGQVYLSQTIIDMQPQPRKPFRQRTLLLSIVVMHLVCVL